VVTHSICSKVVSQFHYPLNEFSCKEVSTLSARGGGEDTSPTDPDLGICPRDPWTSEMLTNTCHDPSMDG
jgi:hypothetical protein